MKKSFFKTAIFAMATAALIFAGCNSDSGGGADYPEITNVTISGIPESAVSGPVELTADVDGNNLEGAGIEYSWEFAEESGYASFENSDAKTSKLVPNCAAEEKEVKIKVTATLKGTENRKSSEVYTVKIAAKQESGTEGSGSGSGSGTGSTEGGSTGGNTESGSTAETGSVSAVVNADGSISCGKCGKIYNFTEQAKNCEHYKCATCGSVYYSQSEVDSCTSHVTVIFKDSGENGNESVTMVIKSGSTVIPPSWEKENFALTWIDENGKEADFDDLISLSEGETEKTVTFTAKWETTYTVTFKDESGTNADVTVDVISGEVVGSVPEWTREHFTFAGWTSSVAGLTTDSAITGDVTFTANWTEDAKYTVKFVDSDGVNGEDTQTVYNGEKANVPAWTKENFRLSWTSSVEGLTIDSAITGDVTFTANWTELPKCTNCGTHYATEDAANNCGKQDGCPKYGVKTIIALVGTDGNVISGNSNVTVTGSVNKKVDNGAITIEYEGVPYSTVKFDSKASAVVTATAGQKITVVGSLPIGKQKCFSVTDANGTETTYKLDSKTTEITTYVQSFTSTGSDTIKRGDTNSIALIIIE
ncbi:MAG: InlB B-repeat-containing protein [Treponema sp.]|uniref:InlB B-repeat-containing protein n=1 Tax=Treponema sp. TaxID=166 RepID=UPI00257AB427|nr:InlB B-repeat-containing protein [Treponema sp.]MBQ9103046.1 InlB B-repeat-containing protein [Treponema sp.]